MPTGVAVGPQGSSRQQALLRRLWVSVWRKSVRLTDLFLAGMGTVVGATLLTSAFAVVAWFVTYVVDHVAATPAIEYSITSEPIDRLEYRTTVRIRNLSKVRISDLSIDLIPPTISSSELRFDLTSDKVVFISPTYAGREESRVFEDAVYYHMEYLQPGNEVELSVDYSVSGQEAQHVKPKLYLSSENAVRPMIQGWDTWIIRHHFIVLLIMCLTWVVAIFFFISRIPPSSHNRDLE